MATTQDVQGVAAIYAPVVLDTAISFEYDPPSLEEMSQRIASTLAQLPWLVAEAEGVIAGYAYASAHRQRRRTRGRWMPRATSGNAGGVEGSGGRCTTSSSVHAQ
jgi:L-amino acid N-acyltransferase YncA